MNKPKQPYQTPPDALVLKGQGSWKHDEPVVAIAVGGSRPYLWIGQGVDGDERHLFTLGPGNARKLARWLVENFDA